MRAAPSRRLRLGTRGSALALAQTRRVAERLTAAAPAWHVELVTLRTAGDRHRDRPLTAFGQVGVFVKELERALLEGRIDAAVHSAKDVPTALEPGLCLAAFPERAPVHDVLVARRPWPADDSGAPALPRGAVVGTASVRRQAQLRHWRPDLDVRPLRGNVDTRLARLFAEGLDAVVLAAAGLERLGLWSAADGAGDVGDHAPGDGESGAPGRALRLADGRTVYAHPLDPRRFVPAPGQGALAVEVREADHVVRPLVAALDDPATAVAVRAERAFLAGVGATCVVPVGAWARLAGDRLVLHAYYAAAWQPFASDEGDPAEPEALGARLAARMLAPRGRAARP